MADDLRAIGRSVDAYLAEVLGTSDLHAASASSAAAKAGLPPIEVSSPHGRLLELLVALSGAQRILEVGTLGAVSTIYLARGAGPNADVVTLEIDEHHAAVARANLANAGLADQVDVRVGPALASLDALIAEGADPFDFVFIDADKESNPIYLDRATSLSHPGTVIYVDNVVRDGGVADESSANPQITGTRAMMDLIAGNDRYEATAIQTLGSKGYDGFLLARVTSSTLSLSSD